MADQTIPQLTEKTTWGANDFVAGAQGIAAGDNRKYGVAAILDALKAFSGTTGWVLTKQGDGSIALQAAFGESALINTLRSFSAPQWLDVAVLTPASNVFTPDLGAAGSFTANIAANSTLANPTIPVGYDTGKVLAWDITFTITGAGGWTLAFGNQYFVDADVDIAAIIADNNTTGDKIQLFFQFKNNVISVQPFIPTAI